MSAFRKLGPITPAVERFRKARTDTARLFIDSVLTAPYPDLAGDIVRPDGLDFSAHQLDPSIDLEHGHHPEVRGMPVAWARESLSEPGAPYSVYHARLNFGGEDGRPDDFQLVPVGRDYFDKSCKVSMQVFALCEQDTLPGRSLEFRAVPNQYKAIGYSQLEGRPSYDFAKAEVLRWTICQQGVCPLALSVTKALPQVTPALVKILRDGRVNVGGTYEPLCPVVLKALGGPIPPSRTVARVEKAMDDEMDTQADVIVDDAMPEDVAEDVAPEAPAANGVTAIYAHADALMAACDQLDADIEASDNPQLISDALKLCEQARVLAEKVKAAGDKHDAKIQAAKGKGSDDAGDDEFEAETEEVEEVEEPADMEQDEDGVFKAVRGVYKPLLKALKAKRFSVLDIEVGKQAAAPAPDPDDERLRKAEARFAAALKLTQPRA